MYAEFGDLTINALAAADNVVIQTQPHYLSAKGLELFLKLTDAMEKEQEKNQDRMQEIAAIISEEEHFEGDVRIFVEEIKRYIDIT